MNQLLKKKVYRSFRNLIFIFPITLFLYLFFSDFGNFGNLLFLSKQLLFEITLGLFLISLGYLLRYFRWRIIISSIGFYPSMKVESKIWLASYSFTATPGKLGELIRCFFLKNIFNIPFKYSFFSVLFERIFDLIGVLILALSFFIINNKILNFERNLFIFFSSLFIMAFFLKDRLVNHKKLLEFFNNKEFKFIGKIFKLKDFYKLKNLNNLFKITNLLKITLLSLFSWSLEGLAFFLLVTKLDFNISIFKAILIHTTAGLIGAITLLPGGLGSTEAITVTFLKLQTIPVDYGIPITSIIRLMTLWYITFLGIISLFIIRKEVFKDE